ncbi:MAG TPA: type II secretion system protein GspC [Steroidobacter sp.]
MSLSASLRELQNIPAQQWLDRASRTLPQAVSVVLVLAIAWQLVQLTWLALEGAAPGPEESVAILPAPAPAAAVRRGPDVQAIVQARLFGEPQVAATPVEEAPQTQMNLILSAVFAAEDPTKGRAIIGESPQSSKVYAVGDTVRSGTRLHAVYLDRVILDRGGQLEQLLLPRKSLATATMASNRPVPPPPTPGRAQFADNLRHIAETNPSAFAEVVRPQPVFANGVQRGYRVYPGRNRQAFAKLGLQPGDLVLSINGTPLDDPQRGMEIFNTIGSSARVSVTVERGGQTQELTLNTAQLTLPEAEAPESGELKPRRTNQPSPD